MSVHNAHRNLLQTVYAHLLEVGFSLTREHSRIASYITSYGRPDAFGMPDLEGPKFYGTLELHSLMHSLDLKRFWPTPEQTKEKYDTLLYSMYRREAKLVLENLLWTEDHSLLAFGGCFFAPPKFGYYDEKDEDSLAYRAAEFAHFVSNLPMASGFVNEGDTCFVAHGSNVYGVFKGKVIAEGMRDLPEKYPFNPALMKGVRRPLEVERISNSSPWPEIALFLTHNKIEEDLHNLLGMLYRLYPSGWDWFDPYKKEIDEDIQGGSDTGFDQRSGGSSDDVFSGVPEVHPC